MLNEGIMKLRILGFFDSEIIKYNQIHILGYKVLDLWANIELKGFRQEQKPPIINCISDIRLSCNL